MESYLVKDTCRYTEWEKINLVKDMIKHLHWNGETHIYEYDELIKPKINKMQAEYESRLEDEKKCKQRREEIDKLLKNELLTDKQVDTLVNEYNELGLRYFGNTDKELWEAVINLQAVYNMYTDIITVTPVAIGDYAKYALFRRIGYEKSIYEFKQDIMFMQIIKLDLPPESDYNLSVINSIIWSIKTVLKSNKCNLSLKSLLIILNAIILDEYDNTINYFKEAGLFEVYKNPEEVFKQLSQPYGPFCNIVDMFITYLEGIDIDRFVQYYPMRKKYGWKDYYSKKYGWKDYYSAIETINECKTNVEYSKDNKFTHSGARWFLIENGLQLNERIIGDLALRLFSTISYGTGIDDTELLMEFLYEASEQANKPNLHIVK